MKKLFLALGLAFVFTQAKAELFLSFVDVDNATAGNVTELTDMAPDNKCFTAAITIVEDATTDVHEMGPTDADTALKGGGITAGVYKFKFSDTSKSITISSIKKGEDRDNNKGKPKASFGFKLAENNDGKLVFTKRTHRIICAKDATLEAGQAVSTGFTPKGKKAQAVFGKITTLVNLPVASE